MRYIIASDFHLKYIESEEDKQRSLLVQNFLESLIGKIDGLILAGDIFDFWLEWKHVIIKDYFEIFCLFKQLKDTGCRLIFLSGNHDFWLGTFLKDQIGFEIYTDIFTETINNKKLFVSHGDLFTSNDHRYHLIKSFIRKPLVHKLALLLHPNISLWIGNLFSRSSKNRVKSAHLTQKQEKGLYNKAEELSREYDIIILGHTHRPLKIAFDKSVYINCGDWITNNSYCYFDDQKIDLIMTI